MTKPVRIALAGAGLIGKVHLDALQRNADCEPSAIVDPAKAARELACTAGLPRYHSLDELFAIDEPDGIIIATPNALHVEHALTCMARDVPVLLEKPLAPTVVDGETIVREAARTGGRLLVGHHRTHGAILRKACEIIDSGVLGRPVSLTGSATFVKPDSYFTDAPWRTQPGGGPILINLIHEVHSLRLLCGEIATVHAFASNTIRGHAVEDTVSINLRFANGALGTFLLSDTAASPHSWEQNSGENPRYAHYGDEDCYVVSGTNGSLAIPTLRLHRYAEPKDRSWWKPFERSTLEVERDDPIDRQLEHFVALIRNETLSRVTAADGLANLRVTEAIALAARTGQTVAVNGVDER